MFRLKSLKQATVKITLSGAEIVFIETLKKLIGGPLSLTQHIVAYSFSSLLKRQASEILNQPEKNSTPDPLEQFVLILNPAELAKTSFELPPAIQSHFQSYPDQNIICIFNMDMSCSKSQNHPDKNNRFEFITDIFTKDVNQTLCSTAGSYIATSILATGTSPLALMGLPVFYICEMGIACLGSYLGSQGSELVIEPRVLNPLVKKGKAYLEEAEQKKPLALELESVRDEDTYVIVPSPEPVTPAFSNFTQAEPVMSCKPQVLSDYFSADNTNGFITRCRGSALASRRKK